MIGRMLAVGVNLLWCRPGTVGGSEEYIARQLVGLAAVAPDIRVRLVVPPGFPDAHPELVARFDVVVGPSSTGRRSGRMIAEARSLPTMVGDVDVVHHAGGTMPPRQSRTTVLTIHDVQYLRFPEYFSLARRTYLRLRLPASVRQADVIAVPSDFVRGTVTEAFEVDPARIVVVPHGVDAPDPASVAAADGLRERYGLGDRRVLVYPAITHPHKGHRFLLDLMTRPGTWSDPDVVLVLLGGRGAADAAVEQTIVDRGLARRVVRPGRVPDADRDGLIVLAEALVFPSEYEGFGAPVIEAMSLGTPVICSDQAALPEVAGEAAIVLPLRPDAWSGALDIVAAGRETWIARGCRRAAEFTTAASGRALATAYRRGSPSDEGMSS
jgi:glycosyltransferase involved in cell wall biosynthesis